MGRCGCVGNECNCAIIGGRGVFLSGSGDEGRPMTVDAATVAYFQNKPGEGAEVSVTGTGSPTDPYVISAGLDTTGAHRATAEFLTPGTSTWSKPQGATGALVSIIGGGQGGQGGTAWAGVGVKAAGGLGGAGGGYTSRYVYLPVGTTHASVVVGAGGGGGPGASGTGITGTFGDHTKVTFFNGTTEVEYVWVGGGGTTVAHWGYGEQDGQQPPATYTSMVQAVYRWSGGAGGGGEGVGGGPQPGGAHVAYVGTSVSLVNKVRGGDGAIGGNYAGGIPRNGSTGYLYGGGGGGGAGGTSVYGPGYGGAGGNGIAIITTF